VFLRTTEAPNVSVVTGGGPDIAATLLLQRGSAVAECANMKQSPSSTRALMSTVRILNIIYVAQAGAGIIFGIAYAVWRMYLA
jgi:hypothetical protein